MLGILDGSLLIVVTRRVRQGEVCGKTIWRVDAVEVIPILRNAGGDDGGPLDEDLAWLTQCVTEVMSTPYFYFSYNSDLTQTQQRLSTSKVGKIIEGGRLNNISHFLQYYLLLPGDDCFHLRLFFFARNISFLL